MFNNIYKDRKVLVTGHTGFKGSWLSLWLTQLGSQVLGYSLDPPTRPNLFEALGLKDRIQHVLGDVRDIVSFKREIRQFQPEFIFHLAAQPILRLSYTEPRLTYETNVMGTLNLFEAIKGISGKCVVINITSDKCYENREWVFGYREDDPMGGFDPYSSSKGCSEIVTAAYRRSFFNPEQYGQDHLVSLASARAGNVIGGGDWAPDRLIPDCIRSLCQKQTIIIRNPKATRPWQHVLDPLSGYLWLGALMHENGQAYCSGWNFGPHSGDVLKVEDLVKKIVALWGGGDFSVSADSQFHEAKYLKLEISKSQTYLAWEPVYSSTTALEQTINWYISYYKDKNRIRDTTLEQLDSFYRSAQEKNIAWAR